MYRPLSKIPVYKNFYINQNYLFRTSPNKIQSFINLPISKRFISNVNNNELEKDNTNREIGNRYKDEQHAVVNKILKLYDTDSEGFKEIATHLKSFNPSNFFNVKNTHVSFRIKDSDANTAEQTSEQTSTAHLTIELGTHNMPNGYRWHRHGKYDVRNETRPHWKIVDAIFYHPNMDDIRNDIIHCARISAISAVIVAAVTENPAAGLKIFYPIFIECLIARTEETMARETKVELQVRNGYGCWSNHCNNIEAVEIEQESTSPEMKR